MGAIIHFPMSIYGNFVVYIVCMMHIRVMFLVWNSYFHWNGFNNKIEVKKKYKNIVLEIRKILKPNVV